MRSNRIAFVIGAIGIASLTLFPVDAGVGQRPARKEPVKTEVSAPAVPQTQPAEKPASLRIHGFIFLELYTKDVPGYINFFRKVAGFEPVHVEPGYAQVQSQHGEMIFNGGHGPFGKNLTGLIVSVILMDLGVQGGHVSNQTRIYSIDPAARSRLNTVYMFCYFIGGGLGSLCGALAWHHANHAGFMHTDVLRSRAEGAR